MCAVLVSASVHISLVTHDPQPSALSGVLPSPMTQLSQAVILCGIPCCASVEGGMPTIDDTK